MWVAYINGWTEVMAFEDTKEKAIEQAIKYKKDKFPEECPTTWADVVEFYGGWAQKVRPGDVIFN